MSSATANPSVMIARLIPRMRSAGRPIASPKGMPATEPRTTWARKGRPVLVVKPVTVYAPTAAKPIWQSVIIPA